MIQQELNDFICFTHKKKIISVCLNQACQKCRLLCFECLKNTEHNSHLNELQDFENLDFKIEETKSKYNNLITQLNQMMDDIINLYKRLKNGIDNKYNLPIQRKNIISSDELSQYIDNMVQFDRYQDTIRNQIQQNCSEFTQILNTYMMELQLDTLSYNVDSQENKDIAQKLYRQGYKLYWEKCDYDGAINFFDSALSFDRTHVDSLWCKGTSLKLKGQYVESIICFDQALSIEANHLKSLHSKGECLKMMGKYGESIEWFEKALKIDPNYVFSLSGKGTSLRKLGQYKEAIEVFKIAYAINPNYLLTLYEYGETLRLLNEYSQALMYLDKALIIDQNHWAALGCKGVCLIQLQRYDEALIYLNKSIQTNSTCEFFKKQLKICQEILQQFKK